MTTLRSLTVLTYPLPGCLILRRYAKNHLPYKSWDYENLARTVTYPGFVMCGELDAQTSSGSAKRILKFFSHATLHLDPRADHYGILREEPDSIVTLRNDLYDQGTAAA